MADDPPTVGLIGLGRMGARLTEAAEAARVRIVAALDSSDRPFALDPRPELRAVFTQDPATFWAARPDLVLIATTAPAHIPILRAGIDAGVRRFMVEKPFCTGVAEGEAALRAIRECGARVVVNHGRRYCPNYAALAALDGSEETGALRALSVTLGAGGLGTLGVHFFDLFNRLFGALPDSVTAIAAGEPPPNPRGAGFHDPGACTLLAWSDGRRALLDMCDDTGIPPLVEARFVYGRVLIENEAAPWRLLRGRVDDRALPLSRYGRPLEETAWPDFRAFGLIEMATAAIHDALADGPVLSGAEAALDAIRVFAAVREAVETGNTVSLPLSGAAVARSFAIP